ncbi:MULTISPECIES: hypothetical protein [unclassified Polaromonas]|uniref:hypothetical protein n=1 Tax=unclassified Polaromonas TaxID=2638319 RepID=UPI0018CB2564|nr:MULTISPECIES: hypothetical protein [unclassified Polaromonas]MBG6071078.1 hypothetical protein [Polaromonas sp. CG_9.7]MBG6113078.1 hypothetical protein [Polaromonas sp. CG_9.2]MDH6185610.1 hypothetical protein [Polaromonas sp. CG_23.6]
MLQQWITGIMVAFAAAYALWYWMPAGLRRRLGRLQKKLGEKPGCGACSSCGGCATAGKRPAAVNVEGQRQPLWMKPER